LAKEKQKQTPVTFIYGIPDKEHILAHIYQTKRMRL